MVDEDDKLTILQVSTADVLGGAEGVARNLFHWYEKAGHRSWLAVGRGQTGEPGVLPMSGRPHGGSGRRGKVMRAVRNPPRAWDRLRGHEDFRFPATYGLLEMPPEFPDVLHCHNLHGRYFDLRALPTLSGRIPTILTLHDAWLLSGHCAHSFECERWVTGCGDCPYLGVYPRMRRDATAYNWKRKQEILGRSRVYVATPCRWLMEKVERSILAPAVIDTRVIPNGVDLTVFRPGDRATVRAALRIPEGGHMVLFTANGIRNNGWKDFNTLRSAVAQTAEAIGSDVLCVALGEEAPPEHLGKATVQFVPFVRDPALVAQYYRAADVYVHAARVETMGMAILEALACGSPVVATAVGGVPEQIVEGKTGFLTPLDDVRTMAEALTRVLLDGELRRRLGREAAADAARRFGLDSQAESYLAWYREILAAEARARR